MKDKKTAHSIKIDGKFICDFGLDILCTYWSSHEAIRVSKKLKKRFPDTLVKIQEGRCLGHRCCPETIEDERRYFTN